jgi:hypothetical protein
VSGAAAEGSGSGIEHAIDALAAPLFAILGIKPLALIVGVVADKEVPLNGIVLRGEGVEARDVVIVGQAIHAFIHGIATHKRSGIASGLKQNDGVTGLGQACRYGAAACA